MEYLLDVIKRDFNDSFQTFADNTDYDYRTALLQSTRGGVMYQGAIYSRTKIFFMIPSTGLLSDLLEDKSLTTFSNSSRAALKRKANEGAVVKDGWVYVPLKTSPRARRSPLASAD
jgi:hypothetical protein